MRLIYNIIHIMLICGLAPWLIGIGYSICVSNFHHALMSGFSMIIFSFPVTFILTITSWIIWRVFYDKISKFLSCFSGMIIGLIIGAMLSYILCDEHYYFLILSGMVGLMIGHIEFYLFNYIMDE